MVLVQMNGRGLLTSSIDRTYPLEQVPLAMRHLAGDNTSGKIAITA